MIAGFHSVRLNRWAIALAALLLGAAIWCGLSTKLNRVVILVDPDYQAEFDELFRSHPPWLRGVYVTHWIPGTRLSELRLSPFEIFDRSGRQRELLAHLNAWRIERDTPRPECYILWRRAVRFHDGSMGYPR